MTGFRVPHFSGEWVGCPGHAQAMPRPCPDHGGWWGFPLALPKASTSEYYGNLWIIMDHQVVSFISWRARMRLPDTSKRSRGQCLVDTTIPKWRKICTVAASVCFRVMPQYVAMPMMLQVQLFVTTHLCKNRGSVSKFPKYQQLAFGRIWFKVNVARSGSLNGLPRLVGRCRFFST